VGIVQTVVVPQNVAVDILHNHVLQTVLINLELVEVGPPRLYGNQMEMEEGSAANVRQNVVELMLQVAVHLVVSGRVVEVVLVEVATNYKEDNKILALKILNGKEAKTTKDRIRKGITVVHNK
jgi:hypothetical protein